MTTEATAEVATAIEATRDSVGLVTPDAVVAAAREPASPLHGHFEWQDTRAAHLYRIGQARILIRSLKIPVKMGPTIVAAVAYVPAPNAIGAYRRIDEVSPRSDEARSIVLSELGRVAGALNRARKIAAVLNLESEIDDLIGALQTAKQRVEIAAPAEVT